MQKEEPNTYIWRHFDESFRKMREGCKGDPLPWLIHHPQSISNAKLAYYRSISQQRTNTRNGGNAGRQGQNCSIMNGVVLFLDASLHISVQIVVVCIQLLTKRMVVLQNLKLLLQIQKMT